SISCVSAHYADRAAPFAFFLAPWRNRRPSARFDGRATAVAVESLRRTVSSFELQMTPPRRIGFVSLGCPKALVDSERILSRLRAEGYETAADYAGADVVVVN